MFPALAGGFFTIDLPGEPCFYLLNKVIKVAFSREGVF